MIVRVLFDGLWQGAAVVGIAYLIVRSVPNGSATTRYAVWFAALLAMVAVPLFAGLSNAGAFFLAALGPHAASIWTVSLLPIKARAHDPAGLLIPATRWIVLAWATGATVCLGRLGASLVRIDQIRRNAAPLADDPRDLLVSADVAIPIAIGFVKPAIIIPQSFFETLRPGDLERIIAHERAHLKRHDVAGNFVQRIVEAVFFFNPWVHLIGRNLVREREAACDDLAIGKTGAPDEYAAFLASLAQRLARLRQPLATPSALGSRHALVGRIERLVNSSSRPIGLNYYVVGGTVMLFALLALALDAFAPALALPAQTASTLESSGTLFVAAACTNPNTDARYLDGPAPVLPQGSNFKGSATIVVTISPDGTVNQTSILKSSGNAQVDRAVLDAAQRGKYSPKRVNCKPVESKYLFHADFAPKQP